MHRDSPHPQVSSLLIIAAARCKSKQTGDRFFLLLALSIIGKRFFCSYNFATTQHGISIERNQHCVATLKSGSLQTVGRAMEIPACH